MSRFGYRRNAARIAQLNKLTTELKTSAASLTKAIGKAPNKAEETQMAGTPSSSLDAAIAALQAQVAQNVTVEGSATTLVDAIPGLIAAAVAKAQAAGATPAELQSLTDLGTALSAAAAPLSAAITANTPQNPTP